MATSGSALKYPTIADNHISLSGCGAEQFEEYRWANELQDRHSTDDHNAWQIFEILRKALL
jgi:hypothetical protein